MRLTPRVLVVDDDNGVRQFAVRALSDAGYEVTPAASGPEALEVVARQPPYDLFVIDLVMPEMRGDELARRLRFATPDIKVLYFTGYCDALFSEKSTLWENEAFLEKPVSVQGLRQAASLLLFGHVDGPGTRAA